MSALMLTWGTVSPATRHTHLGGSDTTHRHDDIRRDELSQHSHDHGPGDWHGEHLCVDQGALLGDCVVHLHWKWLGIDFSLPVPQGPADGNDDGDTALPEIVLVMDQTVPTAQVRPSFNRVLLPAVCSTSPAVVCRSTPILSSAGFSTSIPLCDSARLERSGVLLV